MIRQSQTLKPSFSFRGIIDALNGRWHRTASFVFLFIVIAHWAEHLLQAFQIWGLGWERSHSHGGLGLVFPALVQTEWLHYWYAAVMLIGFLLLRPAYVGRARTWWTIALVLQFWHHFEHALLFGQAIVGQNLFDSPVRVSLIQLLVPRVELHLFYNVVVFVPMVIAMFYHLYPPKGEKIRSACTCALHRPKPAESLAG